MCPLGNRETLAEKFALELVRFVSRDTSLLTIAKSPALDTFTGRHRVN